MNIELDTQAGLAQHEETFTVTFDDGRSERMRLHDYERVYAIPGLYEALLHDRLKCQGPELLAAALVVEVRQAAANPGDLRILDLGAGNGVLGEELRSRGVATPLVGLDNEPAAGPAAARDRPGLYRDYVTGTLTTVSVPELVAEHGLNCLVGAGAIGVGHIARDEIKAAWAAFPDESWLAITFREDVLMAEGHDLSGFAASLLAGEMGTRVLRLERFRYRLRMSGAPIYYYALVARRMT